MSHGAIVLVGLTLALMLIGVYFAYEFGNRAKKSLEQGPRLHAMPPFSVGLSEANATVAVSLSREPIFMKQSPDGLRVQLDNRPLLPLTMFRDPATMAALREIAMRVTQQQGAVWTALINVEVDGSVTVRRLT